MKSLDYLIEKFTTSEISEKFSKADLHIHSTFSKDSLLTPSEIVKLSIKRGIDIIAVTDHNTVKGGVETRRIARNTNLLVIPGVEVRTNLGDVILLFVEEDPKTKDFDELLDLVKGLDAITVLPHPFRGHKKLNHLALNVDMIEVMNGRSLRSHNLMAKKLAELLKKPISAGSDAHYSMELGCVQLLFSTKVSDEEELRRALLNTIPLVVGKESPILVHILSMLTQLMRRFTNEG